MNQRIKSGENSPESGIQFIDTMNMKTMPQGIWAMFYRIKKGI